MTQIQIAGSIIDCIENAKKDSKEYPAEMELLKLKHELYVLVSNICKEIPLVKTKGLTKTEIWEVVMDWYTNGMYPDILQDENGMDLEEICEMHLDSIH